jgi:hypothetical protein
MSKDIMKKMLAIGRTVEECLNNYLNGLKEPLTKILNDHKASLDNGTATTPVFTSNQCVVQLQDIMHDEKNIRPNIWSSMYPEFTKTYLTCDVTECDNNISVVQQLSDAESAFIKDELYKGIFKMRRDYITEFRENIRGCMRDYISKIHILGEFTLDNMKHYITRNKKFVYDQSNGKYDEPLDDIGCAPELFDKLWKEVLEKQEKQRRRQIAKGNDYDACAYRSLNIIHSHHF